jgi:hypothetical protein
MFVTRRCAPARRGEGPLVGAAEQEQGLSEVDRSSVDEVEPVDELAGVPGRVGVDEERALGDVAQEEHAHAQTRGSVHPRLPHAPRLGAGAYRRRIENRIRAGNTALP